MALPDNAMQVAKINEDEQLVFGWASVALSKDEKLVVDSHGDVIEPTDLEQAVYDFMLKARDANERHEGPSIGDVVESLYIDARKAEAMGIESPYGAAWWIGVHIPSAEVFAKVKSGEYEMFSIEGMAVTEDLVYDPEAVEPYAKEMQSDVFSKLREAGQNRWGSDEAYVYVDDFDVDVPQAVFCVSKNGTDTILGVTFERNGDGTITLGRDEVELERVTGYQPKSGSPMDALRRMLGR